MKFASILAATLIGVPTAALADHAVDNASGIARASYRAADAAESLENEAYRDAGYRESVFEDHRYDTLLALGQNARRLHLSLSDLYRVARDAFGGRDFEHATPDDHRGDRIRNEFQRAEADFRAVQSSYYALRPYSISYRIHSLYDSVEDTFANLQWLVYGR